MRTIVNLVRGLFFTLFFLMLSNSSMKAQSEFPIEKIDSTIIAERGLQEKVNMIVEDCNWENRIGGKVDVFWIVIETGGNLIGHVYEYILDCDNIRLIYWYTGSPDGPIVDFMIENAEDESLYVVAKRKHLKNKKKYRAYFNEEN